MWDRSSLGMKDPFEETTLSCVARKVGGDELIEVFGREGAPSSSRSLRYAPVT